MQSPNQSMSIPFTGGLDTKTDDKSTPVGSFRILENGVFGEHGSITKRWGYDKVLPVAMDGTDASGGLGVHSWNDVPVLTTNKAIYTLSDDNGKWNEHSKFTPCLVSSKNPPSVPGEQELGDCCSNGIITLYVWEDTRDGVRASVVDADSGFIYAHDILLDATGTAPKCGVSEGVCIAVWQNTAANTILTLPIQDSDPTTSLSATATTVSSSLNSNDLFDLFSDFENDRMLIAYIGSDALKGLVVLRIDGAGDISGPQGEFDISGAPYNVTVANVTNLTITSKAIGHTNNMEIAIVGLNGTGTDGFALWLERDLSLVSGGELTTSVTGSTIRNIAAGWIWIASGGGLLYAAYEILGASDPEDNYVVIDRIPTSTSPMVGSGQSVIRHSTVASSCGYMNGDSFFMLTHQSVALQNTQFMYHLATGNMVARLNYGIAGAPSAGHLPSLWPNGDSLECAGVMKRRVSSLGDAFETDNSDAVQFNNLEMSHSVFAMNGNVESVEVGGQAYFASGTLMAFDGTRVIESAPALFPELSSASSFDYATTGGSGLTNGAIYLYRFYYERMGSAGELTRSLALTYATTALPASGRKITITIPTLCHTLAGDDGDWRIGVYRTEANAVSQFYLCSSPDLTVGTGDNRYVENVTTADSVEFVDDMSDALLVKNARDPQSEGVLPVVQPPACSIIGEANDRVFMAGGEGLRGIVYPSLIHFPGEAILFSDELQFSVGEEGGNITAMGAIDGALVVFKERRIYAVSGGGPSDTGSGQSFNVQRVTADVGCSQGGSVVETPDGLMFMSAKGIYILTRAFEVEYIGWPVEIFNDTDIVSAEVIPDTNVVVLLPSSGKALAYDYFFKKWTTFTNHSGLGAVTTGGQYHYLRSNGDLYTRNPSAYLDGAQWYPLRLRTAPIRLDSLQDHLQVRRLNLVGEYLSSHRLQMKVFCNRDIVPLESIIWEPDNVLDITLWGDADTALWGDADTELWGDSGDTDYQFQHKFARMNVQSLRLEFQDLQTDGAPGQSCELAEMNFEIGVNDGNANIPAGRKL